MDEKIRELNQGIRLRAAASRALECAVTHTSGHGLIVIVMDERGGSSALACNIASDLVPTILRRCAQSFDNAD